MAATAICSSRIQATARPSKLSLCAILRRQWGLKGGRTFVPTTLDEVSSFDQYFAQLDDVLPVALAIAAVLLELGDDLLRRWRHNIRRGGVMVIACGPKRVFDGYAWIRCLLILLFYVAE